MFNIVRSHVLWLAVALFPVVVAIAQGQDSTLLLLLLSSFLVFLNRGRERSAGFLIALALFKPHLILPIAAVLIWRRGYGFLQGFLAGSTAVLLLSTGITGVHGWLQMKELWRYAVSGTSGQIGVNSASMPNLRGMMWTLGFGAHTALVLSVVLSALLFAVVAWRLRSQRSPEILFPPLMALTLLLSTYVNAHDLAILIIPVLAMLVAEKKSMLICAGTCFSLPLFLYLGHAALFFFVICFVLCLTVRNAKAETAAKEVAVG
jgi:hypothetical protein